MDQDLKRQDFLKDIDLTQITQENTPNILVAMLNQMKVLCFCVWSIEEKQSDINNCLLIFRVSRCGWDWLSDVHNIKAIAVLIGIFGLVDYVMRYVFWFIWPK